MTLTTAMRVAFGSKWLVALRRAQAAGKMLAMQLAQVCVLKKQGKGECFACVCLWGGTALHGATGSGIRAV